MSVLYKDLGCTLTLMGHIDIRHIIYTISAFWEGSLTEYKDGDRKPHGHLDIVRRK